MILQGGFDIKELALPHMFRDGRLTDALVLVTANRDLELQGIYVVSEEMDGSLTPHLSTICDIIEPSKDAFCGIVHAGRTGPVPDLNYIEEAEELDGLLEEVGVRLISHIYVARETWSGVRGMSYFDMYSNEYEFPPTMNSWSRSAEESIPASTDRSET
ncbi:hypothetical protein [uncultured Arthrobacter sp.]|uniref:hypothetical protein n=1 Tax=uncultured Arthrobacter sp. TaxID=114050 RepID=UPI00260DECFB|nr:hypothetical protein [uncultured Arthrobacter sp.]